jgi:undecaprenyl phosphate-alpha-L-ara4N flippase subunit ArnE
MGRLTAVQLSLLFAVAILLAFGQLLFKLGAKTGPQVTNVATMAKLMVSPMVLAAICLYGLTTLLWVYILQQVPLSRAYPFMALGFVLVPMIGVFAFGEAFTWRYAAGVVFILLGLYLSSHGG